jgi:predicted nuclease of predicted toxin-antitoxin system
MQPDSGPNEFMQLAGALAQISPSLQGFMDTQQATWKKEAEDKAMRRIGGMSFEEAKSAVADGSISEMQNPWFKAAFMKQYGERLAYQRVNELTQEYETEFDKNGGDLDSFVRERMAGDLEQYGDNQHFVGAYNQIMDNWGAKANQVQAQYQTEQIKLDTIGGVYETFQGQAQTMRQEGKSPAEIVAALRGNYEGNRSLLNVDYREQDKEMVRLAESYAASGDLDMVQAILNGERTGADGTVLGPLSTNREFQADSARILNAATSERNRVNEEKTRDQRLIFDNEARNGTLDPDKFLAFVDANPGSYTFAQSQSVIVNNQAFLDKQAADAAKFDQELQLKQQAKERNDAVLSNNLNALQSGSLYGIGPAKVFTETGDVKEVPVEQQFKDTAAAFDNNVKRLVELGKVTPDQAYDMMAEAGAANALTFPSWTQALEAGYSATNSRNTSGDELPQSVLDGVDLYQRLYATNPAMVARHMPDESTRNFYERVRMGMQLQHMDQTQSVRNAMAIMADPDRTNNPMAQLRYDDVEKEVRKITIDPWMSGSWFEVGGNVPTNLGTVAGEISRLAKFGIENGLPPKVALKQARERFMQDNVEVNGNFVNIADKQVPPNFSDLVANALKLYAEKHGDDEFLAAEDLTIKQAQNGRDWIIVTKDQVPVENQQDGSITLRSLFQQEQTRVEGVQQGVIDEQGKTAAQVKLNLQSELEKIGKDLRRHEVLDGMNAKFRPLMLKPKAELLARQAEINQLLTGSGDQ